MPNPGLEPVSTITIQSGCEDRSLLRIPSATYRVQCNARFTLADALEFVSYFDELGISDLYTSPLMKSCKGSTHGYDILDFCLLDPKAGSEEELAQLAQALRHVGMGLLMDFVPNHMSIAESSNRWWQDVLENGPASLYADYFNIVWDPPKLELKNKVVLAVLNRPYGQALEAGEVKVGYEEGSFYVVYKARRFPVNPQSWKFILGPVLEQMTFLFTEDCPELLELESVITALTHLPPIHEHMEARQRKERNREKEIIKKRLSTLLDSEPRMEEVLQRVLEELNGQDNACLARLERLLDVQAYRLSFWKDNDINYRRFFDINDLATVRVEEDRVFKAIHSLVLSYIQRGWVTGLRLDHVDGLFDPASYFVRLQQACAQGCRECQRTEDRLPLLENLSQAIDQRGFYVIAEKILGCSESLNSSWSLFGTTGYDYLNLLNGLFVDKEGYERIQSIYDRFTDTCVNMTEVIYQSKREMLLSSMSSELRILTRHLEEISEQHRASKGLTFDSLRTALREVIACFPLYRSYIRPEDVWVGSKDRMSIETAIIQARERNRDLAPLLFDFIGNVLLLVDPPGLTEEQRHYRRLFVMRFQQLTAPVTAKGVEDTAFYRYYPLASLNEVGMSSLDTATELSRFHDCNRERNRCWPHTLLATSTHDTKRSEDVRARLNVLSEEPEAWEAALWHWHDLNQSFKTILENTPIPDNREEYLIYQTLIATWPLYPMDACARALYIERIERYLIKALREAKIHTSWLNVDERYEQAVREFIHRILNLEFTSPFIEALEQFISTIVKAGMFNSLAQVVLKSTSPGIPDFYQGSELWEFNLVDPDNRRPVNYAPRSYLLRALTQKARENADLLVDHLMQTPEDGRIKLYVTACLLRLRRRDSHLFEKGEYIALEVLGNHSQHVVAFSRTFEDRSIIVVVARFYAQLVKAYAAYPPIGKVWEGHFLTLPSTLQGEYQDCFTGVRICSSADQPLPLQDLFSRLPFAVLEKL